VFFGAGPFAHLLLEEGEHVRHDEVGAGEKVEALPPKADL
jgi:hypothetical protein